MNHSDYKKLILTRLGWVNEILGTDYKTDYVGFYGGWNLYRVDKTCGGHYRGQLGFDHRIGSKEMFCYLTGIYYALTINRSQTL